MRIIVAIALVLMVVSCEKNKAPITAPGVRAWITSADQSHLLKEVYSFKISSGPVVASIIEVDSSVTYQSMDGFGFALTGGSAMLLTTKLKANERAALLKELFSTEENGIGISYLRVSIGASDLDERIFSYSDLPIGQSDPSLTKFNLAYDTLYLIPIIKEILAINPHIKIMGSPWSAPAWMKTNHHPKGGSLKPEYYGAYADYFVTYMQSMAREGIHIDAITIQNEPENPNNTPSMLMTAAEQNEFIKRHLGPAFKAAEIKTKIILFDHNGDHPEYPISILDDPETKPFVDGSAFHLYLGEITALSKVHDAHPDKHLYFTEQWTWSKGEFGGDLRWHVKNLIVGATRNWSRVVLEWNLAADENFDPHTDDGGCDSCKGALTIGDSVSLNVSYYIIAHASKFVPPGSVRISSTALDDLPNVAFLTPEGKKVLIALNDQDVEQTFSIRASNKWTTSTLPAGAVGTFVWE